MSESKEKSRMAEHLLVAACPGCQAVGQMKLTGGAKYTDPLAWICKCEGCQHTTTLGYRCWGSDEIQVRSRF